MSFLRSYKAGELDPTKFGVDDALLDLLFEVGMLGVCRSYFQHTTAIWKGYLAVRPESERAHIGMGLLALAAPDFELAVDLFKDDLLKLHPESSFGKVYLGLAYKGLEKFDDAKKCFNEVIELNKESTAVDLAKSAIKELDK